MNIRGLNKRIAQLSQSDSYLKYHFEPHIIDKDKSTWRRHIYYNELKYDFMNEINTYGFSPFIHQSYDIQKKNKEIMKYKRSMFNNGYFNYVKKTNLINIYTRGKLHKSIICNNKQAIRPESTTNLSEKKDKNKEIFSNALRHLPKKRELNEDLSTVSQEFIVNPIINQRNNTLKKISFIKEKFNQSLKSFHNMHSFVNKSNGILTTIKGRTLLRRYEPEFDKTLNPISLIKMNEKDIAIAKEEYKETAGNDENMNTGINSAIGLMKRRLPQSKKKKKTIKKRKSVTNGESYYDNHYSNNKSDLFTRAKLFKSNKFDMNYKLINIK